MCHSGRTSGHSTWQIAVGTERRCATHLRTTKIRPCDTIASWVALVASARTNYLPVGDTCVSLSTQYGATLSRRQLNRESSVASWRQLRSASMPELIVPRTSRSTIGDRVFCMTAAPAWNTLTPSVQSSESLTIFRRRLKTELFSPSFPA